MRRLSASMFLFSAIAGGLAAAEEAQNSQPASVISQQSIGDNACGPCALYNALANGAPEWRMISRQLPGENPADRIGHLIKRYAEKPSESYAGKRHRYTDAHGMTVEDLLAFVNDVLAGHDAPECLGSYMERKNKEPQSDHLRRVHRTLAESLEAGFPPIVDMRSYASRPAGVISQLQGEASNWNGLFGHLVAIVEVQPQLGEDESGFWFRYADSSSGKLESGFVYAERVRDFKAVKGFKLSDQGKEQWEVLSDFPFLLITAPTQTLRTQLEPAHVRTYITLRYAIYRPAKEAESE